NALPRSHEAGAASRRAGEDAVRRPTRAAAGCGRVHGAGAQVLSARRALRRDQPDHQGRDHRVDRAGEPPRHHLHYRQPRDVGRAPPVSPCHRAGRRTRCRRGHARRGRRARRRARCLSRPGFCVSALLAVEDLFAGYVSGVDILQGISLAVEAGSVTVVIGPNGAGKSTLLRTLFGLLKPQRGQVRFAGQEIGGREPAAVKALGIGYVPQEINVFPLLTVEETLRMGGWILRRDRAGFARALERVFDTFPLLAQRRHEPAGALSGGQGRMLSVAREMMTAPTLMLVDEPTAGLAPALVAQVYELLQAARKAGSPILLVRPNAHHPLPHPHPLYLTPPRR